MRHKKAALAVLLCMAVTALVIGTAAWLTRDKAYPNFTFTTGSVDMLFSISELNDFDRDDVPDLYDHASGETEEAGQRVEYVATDRTDGTVTYRSRYAHLYEVTTKKTSTEDIAAPKLNLDRLTPGQTYTYRLKSISEGTVRSTVSVEMDRSSVAANANLQVLSVQAFEEITDFTTGAVTVTPAGEGKQYLVNAMGDGSGQLPLVQDVNFQKNEAAGESSVVILLKVRFETLAELKTAAPEVFGTKENLNEYANAKLYLPDFTITVVSK